MSTYSDIEMSELVCWSKHELAREVLYLRRQLADEKAGRPLLAKATDKINDLEQQIADLKEVYVIVVEAVVEFLKTPFISEAINNEPEIAMNFDLLQERVRQMKKSFSPAPEPEPPFLFQG